MICTDYTNNSLSADRNAHPRAVYVVTQQCTRGADGTGVGYNCVPCTADGGAVGMVFGVLRNGENLGTVCLTAPEQGNWNVVSLMDMVTTEFKRLSWPSSDLTIQPPDGRTLVHFDTNFYTTNDQPVTQTVSLLGQQVQIRATPTTYTWRFGDGEAESTASAGAPYPDLQVVHQYAEKGVVSPSVDTTYSGEFRVGDGAWQQIPETLTVVGDPVQLEVLTARPHLVG